MAQWSKASLKLQFESVAKLFEPNAAYMRWVVDMQVETVVTHGHLWWKRDMVYVSWRNNVLLPMQEVPFERIGDTLVFDVPHLETDFNGRVLGCNFYSHPEAVEYVMFAPFRANTSRVVKGGRVIVERVVLAIEGLEE